jgi:hypothetical protein
VPQHEGIRRRALRSASSHHSVGLSWNTKAPVKDQNLAGSSSQDRQSTGSEDTASADGPRRRGHRVRSALPGLARLRHADALRRSPLIGADRKWPASGQNDANDPKQTSISTRKRDTLRSRWVSNRTGRAGSMERKSVLRSVTGAITCATAGSLASPAFSETATLAASAGPMGNHGGELKQHVTRLAKHELRAAPSSRREGALRC